MCCHMWYLILSLILDRYLYQNFRFPPIELYFAFAYLFLQMEFLRHINIRDVLFVCIMTSAPRFLLLVISTPKLLNDMICCIMAPSNSNLQLIVALDIGHTFSFAGGYLHDIRSNRRVKLLKLSLQIVFIICYKYSITIIT